MKRYWDGTEDARKWPSHWRWWAAASLISIHWTELAFDVASVLFTHKPNQHLMRLDIWLFNSREYFRQKQTAFEIQASHPLRLGVTFQQAKGTVVKTVSWVFLILFFVECSVPNLKLDFTGFLKFLFMKPLHFMWRYSPEQNRAWIIDNSRSGCTTRTHYLNKDTLLSHHTAFRNISWSIPVYNTVVVIVNMVWYARLSLKRYVYRNAYRKHTLTGNIHCAKFHPL